jgi:hypothetical protein
MSGRLSLDLNWIREDGRLDRELRKVLSNCHAISHTVLAVPWLGEDSRGLLSARLHFVTAHPRAGTDDLNLAGSAAVLDQLERTELVPSATGISAVGGATILAETGDPKRFATARALVKRRPGTPREAVRHLHRTDQPHRPRLTTASGRGPGARSGSPSANPVYGARYRHLTTCEHNKLKPTQARTLIAAAILRHLHAVVSTGRAWDPDIATHGIRTKTTIDLAA